MKADLHWRFYHGFLSFSMDSKYPHFFCCISVKLRSGDVDAICKIYLQQYVCVSVHLCACNRLVSLLTWSKNVSSLFFSTTYLSSSWPTSDHPESSTPEGHSSSINSELHHCSYWWWKPDIQVAAGWCWLRSSTRRCVGWDNPYSTNWQC